MTTTHAPQEAQSTKYAWAAGLTTFAAVMLTLVGILDIFRGIMAIAEDDVFLATRNYVFEFDLTGWGWIHLALGIAAVLIGIGLFQAATWARVLGVVVGAFVVIANFLSLPYYPVWSIVMIAMSGFIIWALCVARKEDFDDPFETVPRGDV
ncbi:MULTISPECIES: DUF7144 family membrane protein [unclassified Streptomyces]|uniref:DUF7144 family membrane protein n=1 Tax=unclassified Streptomyces TaxID=2593676 RepID=UPI003D723B59